MSAFPLRNLRAPVDRRKQLLQKLMEQMGQGGGMFGAAGVHSLPDVSGGHPFRSAANLRAFAKTAVTGPTNVAQSVLAQLGIQGNPSQQEHSATPGAGIPGPILPPAPPGLHDPFVSPGPPPTDRTALPGSEPAPLPSPSGPVPIGGGLYFDPATGQIIGSQEQNYIGGAIQRLPIQPIGGFGGQKE